MKALLPLLDELYPSDAAGKLRQLITDAISKGYLTDVEIYALQELLPLAEPKAEDVPLPVQSDCDDDWSEYTSDDSSKTRRLCLQLQQRLSYLLFMQQSVQKAAKREHQQSHKLVNQIL